ncbi:MAG: hypothetical protein IIA48_10540 [Bacteroidetes bacterium]|nr:hypothetical protein [Bacteroidota bacterium]
MFILALLISSIALIISGILLYIDYLKPFDLSIKTAGRITISKNPWAEELRQDCIQLDLVFTNNGARRGVIEDVALELQTNDKKFLFRSYAIVRNRSLTLGKDLIPPSLEPFISFELGKMESSVKRILFIPHTDSLLSNFIAETYKVIIWIRNSSDKKWIYYENFVITIDKDDIDVLAKSKMTKQPDGRYYINWLTLDKVLDQSENELSELLKIINK